MTEIEFALNIFFERKKLNDMNIFWNIVYSVKFSFNRSLKSFNPTSKLFEMSDFSI